MLPQRTSGCALASGPLSAPSEDWWVCPCIQAHCVLPQRTILCSLSTLDQDGWISSTFLRWEVCHHFCLDSQLVQGLCLKLEKCCLCIRIHLTLTCVCIWCRWNGFLKLYFRTKAKAIALVSHVVLKTYYFIH